MSLLLIEGKAGPLFVLYKLFAVFCWCPPGLQHFGQHCTSVSVRPNVLIICSITRYHLGGRCGCSNWLDGIKRKSTDLEMQWVHQPETSEKKIEKLKIMSFILNFSELQQEVLLQWQCISTTVYCSRKQHLLHVTRC